MKKAMLETLIPDSRKVKMALLKEASDRFKDIVVECYMRVLVYEWGMRPITTVRSPTESYNLDVVPTLNHVFVTLRADSGACHTRRICRKEEREVVFLASQARMALIADSALAATASALIPASLLRFACSEKISLSIDNWDHMSDTLFADAFSVVYKQMNTSIDLHGRMYSKP